MMRNLIDKTLSLAWLVLSIFLVATACSSNRTLPVEVTRSVIEPEEVTRSVQRIVEVTRVVTERVEVTRVATQPVEVTRVVAVTTVEPVLFVPYENTEYGVFLQRPAEWDMAENENETFFASDTAILDSLDDPPTLANLPELSLLEEEYLVHVGRYAPFDHSALEELDSHIAILEGWELLSREATAINDQDAAVALLAASNNTGRNKVTLLVMTVIGKGADELSGMLLMFTTINLDDDDALRAAESRMPIFIAMQESLVFSEPAGENTESETDNLGLLINNYRTENGVAALQQSDLLMRLATECHLLLVNGIDLEKCRLEDKLPENYAWIEFHNGGHSEANPGYSLNTSQEAFANILDLFGAEILLDPEVQEMGAVFRCIDGNCGYIVILGAPISP